MKTRVILCTGGIGSGKSVVVRAFKVLGLPAYDCDAAAKDLYDRDPALLADVSACVGGGILDADGRLDRSALSARIFSDAAALKAVEELVHPAVRRDFQRWLEAHPAPMVVLESAILLEKPGFEGLYDYVVAVTAPEAVRVARVVARDGISEQQVLSRMARQADDAFRAARADFILNNDGRQALLPAILHILEKIQEDGKN